MRETVEVTRRLLAMERVTFHGEFVDVDDIEIDIVHGDRSPKHVPIYIAATTGMKMMELAGEIGDGVLLNYLVGPGYNREAMEHLAAGAVRGGPHARRRRPAAARRLLAGRRPLARARPGARAASRSTSGSSRTSARRAASTPALLEEIGRILTWPATQAQIEQAMGLVPDDVVQLITASGTADECRAKVQEYVDAGCTCPVLYPLGDDVPAMIEAFATVAVR